MLTDELLVRHLDGDRFAIDVRGHTVFVDQPLDAGGDDTAPTPTELFVAALGSCVAFYARRYLARHSLPEAGLAVAVGFDIGGRPTRVNQISVRVTPPAGLPPERRDALLAVASHCTVHNTLMEPPRVEIVMEPAGPELPGAAPDDTWPLVAH